MEKKYLVNKNKRRVVLVDNANKKTQTKVIVAAGNVVVCSVPEIS